MYENCADTRRGYRKNTLQLANYKETGRALEYAALSARLGHKFPAESKITPDDRKECLEANHEQENTSGTRVFSGRDRLFGCDARLFSRSQANHVLAPSEYCSTTLQGTSYLVVNIFVALLLAGEACDTCEKCYRSGLWRTPSSKLPGLLLASEAFSPLL